MLLISSKNNLREGKVAMESSVLNINYIGRQGFGSACVVFLNGEIFGTDVAGAEYTGSYKEENGKIVGEVHLNVPAGVALVTGAPVSSTPYIVPIPFSMPSAMHEGQVAMITVQLPTGPVNANVKKVKDLTTTAKTKVAAA